MIQVSGETIQPNQLKVSTIENKIAEHISSADNVYSYPSKQDLLFELTLRKNIIDSANLMNESEAGFTTFQYARCNPMYWILTSEGGFRLRPDVSPSDAISDIFQNSPQYAFECATACVILIYHAVLKSLDRARFDYYFRDLYLYSWHTDTDLGLQTYYGNKYIPGDIVYFANPDFSPALPWFRGENAVAMTDDNFFGHGLGIRTADEMIEFLNEQRYEGSTTSAYFTNLITHPSFQQLAQLSVNPSYRSGYKIQAPVLHHNQTSICYLHYLAFLKQFFLS
ncbi:protein-glutamine gamma-glutamyltransferase [Thalassobacillus hwangdonensis]|uniref:Protein-glutamine gamma-glutamyltransferase n=1 Tax=Thalassobacillus hwangdonensis TaxID=546108 RepID=A0ABW3L6G9_9BACI